MGPQIPFTERLANLLKSESEGVRASLDKTKNEFSQGTLKGNDGERIVREKVKKYLPRKYGFANGQIIDSHGGESKEVDIAICNDGHPFTYEDGGQGILFIEGVDCCIEVKSRLNEHHLKAAIKNCQSIRELQPEIPEATKWVSDNGVNRLEMIPYAVFAFESDYSAPGLIKKIDGLNKKLNIDYKNTIDMIYMLDTGLVYNFRQEKFQDADLVTGYSEVAAEPELLMFLLHLSKMMPSVSYSSNILDFYFKPYKY